MTLILVDADAVAFRAAAAVEKEQWVKTVTLDHLQYPCEPFNVSYPKGTRKKDIPMNEGDTLIREKTVESEENALHLVRGMMSSILAEFPEDASIKLFFTPLTKTCFRYTLYPEYKANRTKERPVHLEAVRNYLKTTYAFEEADHLEADDLLVDAMNKDTVLVHNDKDLDQAPGKHYNFVTREHYTMREIGSFYCLCKQILMGDSADNIKGIKGMGPQRAEIVLRGCTTIPELQEAVGIAYDEAGLDEEYFNLQVRLCKLGDPVQKDLDECFILYGNAIKELGNE